MRVPPRYYQQPVYGPFKRRLSDSQSRADMRKILASGELWGTVPRDRQFPAVQAYHGRLEPDEPGFEFFAATPPDHGHGPPHWRSREDGSVRADGEYVKIRVYVTRVSEDLL